MNIKYICFLFLCMYNVHDLRFDDAANSQNEINSFLSFSIIVVTKIERYKKQVF